jgi:hypothetical protein
VRADTIDKLNADASSKELALDIVPQIDGDECELTVLWEGKPLPDAEVSVAVGDGEAVKKKTDKRGRILFKPEGSGVFSALTSRMDEEVTGTLDDKPYDHGLHYASLTFDWPIRARRDDVQTSSAQPRFALPPLPEPLSSFGAVVSDGWLYIYGGHTGTEHEHSAENLSNNFRRINLSVGAQHWQELPMQTSLQGLALVAQNGKVYRIGGMNARNPAPDDEEELYSTAEFAEFDPSTGQWNALAPLPAPRSSHNSVVIGDRLYVVGGWALSGSSPGQWQETALVYDFAEPHAGWQTLPDPPFNRRALAISHWNHQLVVIGGIDEEGEVSQRVDVFDPQTSEWSEGPELPGDGMAGFGLSAWNLDGELYVSGMAGVVYRLSDSGSEWEEVTRKAHGRFFHQLVPAVDSGLLAIGGASREGHLADIEWIDVGD